MSEQTKMKPDPNHIPLKRILWGLIRELGELWGEDKTFVQEYAKDVYNEYKDNLEEAIECFKLLKKQAELINPLQIPVKTSIEADKGDDLYWGTIR